jgi:2'-5' RNA ligase
MPSSPPPPRATAPARLSRVFFALWPDAAARERLAALARDVAHGGGGRPTPAHRLHVTLAFVGDVPVARQPALEAAGAQAARAAPPFRLALAVHGGVRHGELAWIAPAVVPPPLVDLRAALDGVLAAADFAVEQRAFRPHVTLARDNRQAFSPPPDSAIEWTVARLTLMASASMAGGTGYRELAGWDLGEADSPAAA